MKAVQVKYTVQPEYVAQNKANILKVMEQLKANPIQGMYYSSFLLDDGQTFLHFNIARDEQTMAKLNEVQEFIDFRKALKESKPISPPKSMQLDPVAAGFNL